MERGERIGVVVVLCCMLCVLVNKNDDSTVSITNTGCFRCDNQCRVHIVGVHFFLFALAKSICTFFLLALFTANRFGTFFAAVFVT